MYGLGREYDEGGGVCGGTKIVCVGSCMQFVWLCVVQLGGRVKLWG